MKYIFVSKIFSVFAIAVVTILKPRNNHDTNEPILENENDAQLEKNNVIACS